MSPPSIWWWPGTSPTTAYTLHGGGQPANLAQMDRRPRQTRIAETSRRDRRPQTARERRPPADHRGNAPLLPGLPTPQQGDDDRARTLRPDDEASWRSSQSRFALGRGDGRQDTP